MKNSEDIENGGLSSGGTEVPSKGIESKTKPLFSKFKH